MEKILVVVSQDAQRTFEVTENGQKKEIKSDMGFSVKTVKGEKGERTFQTIRLRNFYAL